VFKAGRFAAGIGNGNDSEVMLRRVTLRTQM